VRKIKMMLLLLFPLLFCDQLPLQADPAYHIRIYKSQHTVRMKIGEDKAVCDGKAVSLAAASFNLNGVSYIPLRSAACLAKAQISWNSQVRQAEISFIDRWRLRKALYFLPDDDRAFFGTAPAGIYSEQMGYPSILQQGRLFVPARYLSLLLNRSLHYCNREIIFYWSESKAEVIDIPDKTDKSEVRLSMLCAEGVNNPDLVVWHGASGQGVLKWDNAAAEYAVINGKRYSSFRPILQLEPGANTFEIFAEHISTGTFFTINYE
jgi:hypothetical protein